MQPADVARTIATQLVGVDAKGVVHLALFDGQTVPVAWGLGDRTAAVAEHWRRRITAALAAVLIEERFGEGGD